MFCLFFKKSLFTLSTYSRFSKGLDKEQSIGCRSRFWGAGVGSFSFLYLTSGDFILISNKFILIFRRKTWQI
jgi:hypothetical protein